MSDVAVHLTRRFSGETVVISVDGKRVASVDAVKTDPRTGLARVVRVLAPDTETVLRVEVPTLGKAAEVVIDPSHLEFVTASIRDGELRVEPVTKEDYLREPRGYA
jgi:hypothetical protein